MTRLLAWVAFSLLLFGAGMLCLAEGARKALAQEMACWPTAVAQEALTAQGEVLTGVMTTSDGQLMFWITENAKTGAWHLLVSTPGGATCLVPPWLSAGIKPDTRKAAAP